MHIADEMRIWSNTHLQAYHGMLAMKRATAEAMCWVVAFAFVAEVMYPRFESAVRPVRYPKSAGNGERVRDHAVRTKRANFGG